RPLGRLPASWRRMHCHDTGRGARSVPRWDQARAVARCCQLPLIGVDLLVIPERDGVERALGRREEFEMAAFVVVGPDEDAIRGSSLPFSCGRSSHVVRVQRPSLTASVPSNYVPSNFEKSHPASASLLYDGLRRMSISFQGFSGGLWGLCSVRGVSQRGKMPTLAELSFGVLP